MSASIPITLRPLPANDGQPLFEIIGRINTEFPGRKFKDVTEDFLLDLVSRERLAAQDAADHDDSMSEQSAPAAGPETHDDRRRELYAARNEIQRYLVHANNEVAMLKDFMSLLLTHYNKSHAETSMSPELKNFMHGHLGTLAFDVHPAEPRADEDKKADHDAALGWKLKSLDSIADKLLHSAARLNREMKTETRYWDQVLQVQEAGWPITKTRERGILGVRYGFSESGPHFKSQGFASMRPDHDGNVKLDQGLKRKPRCVRIQVRQGPRILSSSVVPAAEDDAAPLESVIRQARDTLFEEELFFELAREAPSLLGAGVQLVDNVVLAPLDAAAPLPTTLAIDLVPLHPPGFATGDPTSLASIMALALRLLMSSIYRARFHARNLPPKPLSKSSAKQQKTPHALLRPLLNLHAHFSAAASLKAFLKPLAASLQRAKLPGTLAIETTRLDATGPEALVKQLSTSLDTRFRLALAQQAIHVTVSSEQAPRVGARFSVVHAALDAESRRSPAIAFSALESLQTYLIQATRLDVLEHALARVSGWTLDAVAGSASTSSGPPGEGGGKARGKRATVLIGAEGNVALAWGWGRRLDTVAGKWTGEEGGMDVDGDGLVDTFARLADQVE